MQSIAQLNNIPQDFEGAEGGWIPDSAQQIASSLVDAVVSYEFTDHCNKQTLLEVDADTPIYAPRAAARSIKSWKRFHTIREPPIISVKQSD